MVKNGVRGGICQASHRYATANNKYINNYDKKIQSSNIAYLDANNLYGWAMSQKLPVNGFEWVEEEKLSKFNEDFIKNYDENSDTGYFFGVDVEYPKHLILTKICHFYRKDKKKSTEKIICEIEDKEKYVIHMSFKTSTKSRLKTKKCA